MNVNEIGGIKGADRRKICKDFIHTRKYGKCDGAAADDRTGCFLIHDSQGFDCTGCQRAAHEGSRRSNFKSDRLQHD